VFVSVLDLVVLVPRDMLLSALVTPAMRARHKSEKVRYEMREE
jgi:hypothetical protein